MLFQRQINLHTTGTGLLRKAERNQDLGGEDGTIGLPKLIGSFNSSSYWFAANMEEFSLDSLFFFL